MNPPYRAPEFKIGDLVVPVTQPLGTTDRCAGEIGRIAYLSPDKKNAMVYHRDSEWWYSLKQLRRATKLEIATMEFKI